MELGNLIIAIVTLGGIAASGLGILIWAYNGSGSVVVLFREVMPVPDDLGATEQTLFQQGIAAYITGQYRRSAARFSQIRTHPAALHNLGLALANLRQDDRATRELLNAAAAYQEIDDRPAIDLVKRQLTKIRQRKRDREEVA
jgi:hypothetical protein